MKNQHRKKSRDQKLLSESSTTFSSGQWTTPKGTQKSWSRDAALGPQTEHVPPSPTNQGGSEGAGLASRVLLALGCHVTWVFAPHMTSPHSASRGGALATHAPSPQAHSYLPGSVKDTCQAQRSRGVRLAAGTGSQLQAASFRDWDAHIPGHWVPLQNPQERQ